MYLANRPSFLGYSTGAATVPANAWTAVVLDSEYSDPWQGHSPLGTSPQNYYCQSPGWYLAEAYLPWQYTGGAVHSFGVSLGVNTAGGLVTVQGQQAPTNSGQPPGNFTADLVQLLRTGTPGAANTDYVQIQAWDDVGGGASLSGSEPNVPRLSLRWAGTGAASSLPVPSNAAWPVPPSFIDTAWLEANVTQMLGFLANPPAFRSEHFSFAGDLPSTTWPHGTPMALGNGPVLDNYSAFDPSGQQYVVPQPGVYYAYGQVSASAAAGSAAYATGITKNGGTTVWGGVVNYPGSGAGPVCTGCVSRFRCQAGDTLQLTGFQNSGSGLTADIGTRMVLYWESA